MTTQGKLQLRTQAKKVNLLMYKEFLEIYKNVTTNLRGKWLKDMNRQFTGKEHHKWKAERIDANISPEIEEPLNYLTLGIPTS